MDSQDRFGMPPEAFQAAAESHGANNPIFRWGAYVPTRGEVASMPPKDLLIILDGWFWESPVELIPSREQVTHVRAVLANRADAQDADVQELIALCDDMLSPPPEEEG